MMLAMKLLGTWRVPPAVVNDATKTNASTAVGGNVLTNDSGGTLYVSAVNGLPGNVGQVVAGSNGGDFAVSADGSWTFDPDGDFSGLSGSDTATTSVSYHASDGQAEASATLTVTVSSAGLFVFEESFDSLRSEFWDISGLASALASGGQLVTEANANTFGAHAASCARYIGMIPDGFVVHVDLDWVARPSCLGEMFLAIGTSQGLHFVGVGDYWDTDAPAYASSINGSLVTTGASTAPASGSVSLSAMFSAGHLTLYRAGVQIRTAAITGPVTGLFLTNTRYDGYAGITAKWDNFRIEQL